MNDYYWNDRKATEEYGKNLHQVVEKLFGCLSLGLGLAPDELKIAVGGDELVYNLKINYYPPCPRPDLVLGVPAHTDLCALTILVPNQVQGLQVHRDQYWYDVAYIPNALIIHIGDQIEVLNYILNFILRYIISVYIIIFLFWIDIEQWKIQSSATQISSKQGCYKNFMASFHGATSTSWNWTSS